MEIDRGRRKQRLIGFGDQKPIRERIAQDGRALTQGQRAAFRQRILKQRFARTIERAAEGKKHFNAWRPAAALKHTNVLKTHTDKLTELFLCQMAGMSELAKPLSKSGIINSNHDDQPVYHSNWG